jgi:hypothetical protein
MEGCLSKGSVEFFRVSGVVGGHGGWGRFPGRHELKVGVFDQSWSGSYARAGYLKTLVRRRARILRTGAAWPGGRVAHSPCSRARGWRRWRPSWCSCAPRQPSGSAGVGCRSVRFSSGSRPPSRTRRARVRTRPRLSLSAFLVHPRGESSESKGAAVHAMRPARRGDPGRLGGQRVRC